MNQLNLRLLSILLIATLLAGGCNPAPIVAAHVFETTEPSLPAPTPIQPVLSPTQTASPAVQSPSLLIPDYPAAVLPQTQPTPDAVPLEVPALTVSAETGWRPPLYAIPWAPGPEDHFYFNRPILADEMTWLLDDYKYGYIYEGFDNVHTGTDIDASMGTPVHAAAGGKIIWASYGLMSGLPDPDDPYGLAIAIQHDFGFKDQHLYTVYAHLSQAYVHVGDLVETGQLIGLVGITGASTGPHLHFEVRIGENDYFASRNPELWMAPAQGWGLLVGQIKDTAGRLIKCKGVYVTQLDGTEHWTAMTYGARSIHSDDYYGENMVLSDLTPGRYLITFEYLYQRYYLEVEILPGHITYFSFQGRKGFSTDLPGSTEAYPLLPATP